jgi:hypothetical protein
MATDHLYTNSTDVSIDTTGTVNIANHNGSTTGLKLDEVLITATALEINNACDNSGRVVNLTTTPLTMSQAVYGGRTLIVNKADGTAITLPAASGSGTRFKIIIGTLISSNTTTITTGAGDFYVGLILAARQSSGLVTGFMCDGSTSNVLTFNGTTQGGVVGDEIILEDIAANKWACQGRIQTVGASSNPVS